MNDRLARYLAELPLIAILRGLPPGDAEAVGDALFEAGFRLIEVPLNSPEPFVSIERLARRHQGRALVGAGTVLTVDQVEAVATASGELIVMPHADPRIVAAAKARGLLCLPGVATPTEAFAALAAGANGLKAFPAEMLPPAVIRAWRAVLPPDIPLFPVGGITPGGMADYLAAGVAGFGLGSALYRAGDTAPTVAANARAFAAAYRVHRGEQP